MSIDHMDTEVFIVEPSGEVIYANRNGRALIDAPVDKDGSLGDFASHWQEDRSQVVDLLRRLSGTSQWLPFSLTRASGGHARMRMGFQGKGILSSAGENGEQSIHVLIQPDPLRERAFSEHRRLIRELNSELARGQRSERLLEKLLDNQKRLHRELVHRVKNNLSLLSSLLRMNQQRTNNPELNDTLDEMQRRIMSIATVHDVLDRNEETDFVQADELIDTICGALEKSIAPSGVSIRRDLMNVRLHVADATPLALIINELVTNALKHAFPEGRGGVVDIGLRKNGVEKLEASIADDGIGMDGESHESGTGSRIIEALAQQLGAELNVTRGGGTHWQLVFPPSDERGFRDITYQ